MWRKHTPVIVHFKGKSANKKENALTKTQYLMCPRYDEPPCDDMDEAEKPLGWNELSKDEKLDILDFEMDLYWKEIIPPIDWWKHIALLMIVANVCLMFYI